MRRLLMASLLLSMPALAQVRPKLNVEEFQHLYLAIRRRIVEPFRLIELEFVNAHGVDFLELTLRITMLETNPSRCAVLGENISTFIYY